MGWYLLILKNGVELKLAGFSVRKITWAFSKITLVFRKIPSHFRKIPSHFRKIIVRERCNTMSEENKIVVVVKGVLLHDGRVLLLKRAADDVTGAGTWETVGGKIEFGEDIEAALIREIHEETGLTVTVGKILYATTFKTNPTRQVVLLTYLCRSESPIIQLSNEHTDYRWAETDQMKLLLPEEIINDFERNGVYSSIA
jgi:8-oxo-dGTP diphosphatase